MKIMDNGVIRDMTPEEVEAWQVWHDNTHPVDPPEPGELTAEEALDILLGGDVE